MDKKKEAVGVQVLGKGEDGELVAVLQVRAKWNAEKNTPESWAGACQVTAHGKCEEGEDFIQALFREITEELDNEIAVVVKKLYESGKVIELINKEDFEKHIITYGAVVEENVLQNLMKKERSNSFGGFKIIKRDDIEKIIDIKTIDKTTGVTDENTIAMFPDQKEALRIAFEKLS